MSHFLNAPYFEGWYFKMQNEKDTVILIPAIHRNAEGEVSALLQVVVGDESFPIEYTNRNEFGVRKDRSLLRVGKNQFCKKGLKVDVKTTGVELRGALKFSEMMPPKGDVMGPFRFLPFLQCRHSVFSLWHTVTGKLTYNGRDIVFQDSPGYMEGDRGTSFPKRYLWTQYLWNGNCVMASVADVPVMGHHRIGCLCCVLYGGVEYRIATYNRAKIVGVDDRTIVLKQDDLTLFIRSLEECGADLRAPDKGDMTRIIHECAAGSVRYKFMKGDKILFDFTTDKASFESVWNC